jgi:hypothetical protein
MGPPEFVTDALDASARGDQLDQALVQELVNDFVRGGALQFGQKLYGAVLALRGGRQKNELCVSEFHRDRAARPAEEALLSCLSELAFLYDALVRFISTFDAVFGFAIAW